jgi:hypothetical protein
MLAVSYACAERPKAPLQWFAPPNQTCGSRRYRLPRRRAWTLGAPVALLFPAARLPVAPAAVRPGPQPGVVEPAPEQLGAMDDPADADQPRPQDQDGTQRAIADRVAGDERLEDQTGEDP